MEPLHGPCEIDSDVCLQLVVRQVGLVDNGNSFCIMHDVNR